MYLRVPPKFVHIAKKKKNNLSQNPLQVTPPNASMSWVLELLHHQALFWLALFFQDAAAGENFGDFWLPLANIPLRNSYNTHTFLSLQRVPLQPAFGSPQAPLGCEKTFSESSLCPADIIVERYLKLFWGNAADSSVEPENSSGDLHLSEGYPKILWGISIFFGVPQSSVVYP